MATHSSILAGIITWTEDPGGLGSQRVGHEWATACVLTHTHTKDSMNLRESVERLPYSRALVGSEEDRDS